MTDLDDIIGQIEIHSVEGIRKNFEAGIDPNCLFRGEPLIYELTSEYGRGPRFKKCVQAFVDYGLQFDNQALLSVLLDDADTLEKLILEDPGIIHIKHNLRCTYTPLFEASLLHICAEFNHLSCAEVLIRHGVDVNIRAGIDEHGFGGQSPIFHTVNQNMNQSAEMLDFLLEKKAELLITVPGLIWGKSYDWETLIPAVNPISYAMLGLLPQMHRSPSTIASVVSNLLKHAYGIDYMERNIPNKYLMT